MVQKECNCKTCSGVLPELDQENTTEVTKKETRSIYDQLADLDQSLSFLNGEVSKELNRIMNNIDKLDDDILVIQKEALSNPKEYTQLLLGELSKKLY